MERNKGALEALLFVAGEPVSVARMSQLLELPKPRIWELLSQLEQDYASPERGLLLRQVEGGYQLTTKPEYYELLNALIKTKEVRLSTAAMETLAIIALKQPVTKAEIEALRGVKADRPINTLVELELICEQGRKKALGNPILYATTSHFLTAFGLNSLKDLPQLGMELQGEADEAEESGTLDSADIAENKAEETASNQESAQAYKAE